MDGACVPGSSKVYVAQQQVVVASLGSLPCTRGKGRAAHRQENAMLLRLV